LCWKNKAISNPAIL